MPIAARCRPIRGMRNRTLIVGMGLFALATVHCGGAGMCPELSSGAASASFTEDAKANVTIRAFVEASGELKALADKIEGEVSTACLGIGHDLGLSDDQMKAKSGEGGKASGACEPVAAKIEAILKAGGSASLRASFTPPECHATASAEAECAGKCTVEMDPGYIAAHCSPAELSGTCEGTCSGECDGTCQGDCAGTCEAKDASGKCAGVCKGTCHGKCEATCHAKCEGTWKAPQCKATIKPPSADANCHASCKAHAEMKAECSEPKVEVVSSVHTAEMEKLVATLKVHLPVLIRAEIAYGKRLAGAIETLVKVSGELPSAVGKASLHAAACVGAAAEATVHAQASIKVSVQASASVNGKAHAG